MKKIRSLLRSYTDPDLYQSFIQKTNSNRIRFEFSENSIPTACNKALIRNYLASVYSVQKDFIFNFIENKLEVYFALEGFGHKDPFSLLREYILQGERLASTNKMHLLIEGILIASIVVISLIAILLLSFIPYLLILLSPASVPLLIMTFFVSAVLFCVRSLPGFAEISAVKQEFSTCEENLTNRLDQIRKISFTSFLAPQPQVQIEPEPESSRGLNPIDIGPSTSSGYRGEKFFVPPTSSYSLEDERRPLLETCRQGPAILQTTL